MKIFRIQRARIRGQAVLPFCSNLIELPLSIRTSFWDYLKKLSIRLKATITSTVGLDDFDKLEMKREKLELELGIEYDISKNIAAT